jgi:hypothetical protein
MQYIVDPDPYGSALILVSRIRIWIQEGKVNLNKIEKSEENLNILKCWMKASLVAWTFFMEN